MHSRFFLTYYFDRLGYSNRLTRGILRDFEIVCHICIRSVIFDVFLHTKPADFIASGKSMQKYAGSRIRA